MARSVVASLVLAVATLGNSACGEVDEALEDEAPAPLMYNNGATKWPGTIPVCFSGSPPTAEQNAIKSALKLSWPQMAKVDFDFRSSCPTSGSYVKVVLTAVKDWGGIGGTAGFGVGSPNQVNLSYCNPSLGGDCSYSDELLRGTAIHEFGHVLGFWHEHQRRDRPSDLGTWCSDAATSEPPINNGLQDGEWLTTKYDPGSVMNYCRDQNGDRVADGYVPWNTWNDRLSLGDMSGVAKKYSFRYPGFLAAILLH